MQRKEYLDELLGAKLNMELFNNMRTMLDLGYMNYTVNLNLLNRCNNDLIVAVNQLCNNDVTASIFEAK